MKKIIILFFIVFLNGCILYKTKIIYEENLQNEFQVKWRIRYDRNNLKLLLFSDEFNKTPIKVEVNDRIGYSTIFDSTVIIPKKIYYGIPFNSKTDKLKVFVNKKEYKLKIYDTLRVVKILSIHNDKLNIIYCNNFESGE